MTIKVNHVNNEILQDLGIAKPGEARKIIGMALVSPWPRVDLLRHNLGELFHVPSLSFLCLNFVVGLN